MTSKILDQFYTKTKVAIECYEIIKKEIDINKYKLIEPSAGTGSFSNLFHNNSISLDLEPKQDYIIKQDFFDFAINESNNPKKDNIVTIGNPPFGKNSSLAIKFFNKSAEYSDYICMILPKTFKKDSVINKLDFNFHLIKEVVLEKNSFMFSEKEYDVKCVFQIWKKEDSERKKIPQRKESEHFNFVNKSDNPDFAIRRVGGLAGKVIEDFKDYKESSHYYIKSTMPKNKLIKELKNIYEELNEQADNSAGNPSLSKHELITILEKNL